MNELESIGNSSTGEYEHKYISSVPLYSLLQPSFSEPFMKLDYYNYTNQKEPDLEGDNLLININNLNDASSDEKGENIFSEKKDFCQNFDNKVKEENQPIFLGKKTKEKKKIFEINKNKEKYIYRFDYYLKAFKTNFISYSLRFLNETYEEFLSKFGESELKQKKFHLPNYKKVQGNTKELDNREFVKKKLKDILIEYDKEDGKKSERTRNQEENEELINSIYNIKGFPSGKEQNNLKNLLEMKIENLLDKYYEESEEFEKFSNNKKINYYDQRFYKERNRKFSLLKKKEVNSKCGFMLLMDQPLYSTQGQNKDKTLLIRL